MRGQRYHGGRRRILPFVGVALTVWWWWRRRAFRVAVEGESMTPTLRPGEFLIAISGARPKRGSLVVVEHPERPGYEVVKRVAGVPGDEVEGLSLEPAQFWVLGDNANSSADSRSFGPVTADAIKGVVRIRYWPIARAALL